MIDVIIPAFNCKDTIGRTLSSLVAQTDNDFIVTIVDDCSDINFKEIIDDYCSKLNIKYIRNKENKGCGMSRQVGIDNTACSHFMFLDSDDILMPYTIETLNSIIKSNPNIEFLHSYFYEQTKINGDPALILHKDGYTWCHGKLYNRKLIEYYGIKNSPIIKYADDSFFNSMCSELLDMQVIHIPLYLWCNNLKSVTRKHDPEREQIKKEDFLLAMKMSKEFVLKYKNSIDHLEHTLKNLNNINSTFSEKELMLIKEIERQE